MAHADFVHLRVHSAYSLSEGAIKIEEIVALCGREGMPAVAVTDTCNLFGALEFAIAAAGKGVQPIIGCQLAVRRPDDAGQGAKGAGLNGGSLRDPDLLVLLVQNERGYRNLLKLASKAYLETELGEAPQVSLDEVEQHAEGLIALTGGPEGAVGRLLSEGQIPAAEVMLDRLAILFPSRLYVELMRHGLEVEQRIENNLLDLAYARDLPLVATNDAYFADEDMYEAHDALLCIAQRTTIAETDRRRLTPQHRFRDAAEMRAAFSDLPEAIDNTLVIARRCAYAPEPRDPILPAYPAPQGFTEAEALRDQAEEGLAARLEAHVFQPEMDEPARLEVAKPYRDRLEYELGVIIDMGYPGYFLIVADFIKWAKDQGIPVGPGRGSGAGSVVAWALIITDLDPLRFGLLFERFLNPERISMPDFDIDFCQDRRDEVIQYVQEKYGRDRVAQIITFGKLQARAVLRDVGRVLGMPYGQVDRICKLVPYNPAHPPTLKEAINGEPQLQDMQRDDETVARLTGIALKLEGLYRHASTHAAGVVIGDRPLDELLPLYRDPHSDMTATQFSMKYVELAGLVKFDFLGLKTLTVLARATEFLAARGVEIDLLALPLEDPASFAMLGRGDTTGVFQLESAGMRDVLRQLKPDSFGDIIALVALYRPGPMDNIPRYIACKHGEELPDYLHPTLEGILKETYGVTIYQEQVMHIAQVLSGYSLGSADILRRAMGKKIKSEMEAQRHDFVEGAMARGVDQAKASHIFDQVDKFAGYGFNKSHAAAYALVAYQTAYLKAHYPVEFFAASMTLDLGNTDKLNVFHRELKEMGIGLLPPDINASGVAFTVEDGADAGLGGIRYALAAIKNVGAQAMAAAVEERDRNGPFKDLFDFAERLDTRVINKRQLENLAVAGAFDGIEPNRRRVFEGIEQLMRHAGQAASERESTQESLFGTDASLAGPPPALPEIEDWPVMERLRRESEALGFYLSAHPLQEYDKPLERLSVVSFGSLTERIAAGVVGRVKLVGVVEGCQERTSAKGNRFAFIQLSDASGSFEVVVFAELLAASRGLLHPGSTVLVTTEARAESDALRLMATAIEPLDAAVAKAAAGLKVFLSDSEPLASLHRAIEGRDKGRGRLSLVLDLGTDAVVEVALPGGYVISPDMRSAIGAVPGIVGIEDV